MKARLEIVKQLQSIVGRFTIPLDTAPKGEDAHIVLIGAELESKVALDDLEVNFFLDLISRKQPTIKIEPAPKDIRALLEAADEDIQRLEAQSARILELEEERDLGKRTLTNAQSEIERMRTELRDARAEFAKVRSDENQSFSLEIQTLRDRVAQLDNELLDERTKPKGEVTKPENETPSKTE
jgi:hypothetical protein